MPEASPYYNLYANDPWEHAYQANAAFDRIEKHKKALENLSLGSPLYANKEIDVHHAQQDFDWHLQALTPKRIEAHNDFVLSHRPFGAPTVEIGVSIIGQVYTEELPTVQTILDELRQRLGFLASGIDLRLDVAQSKERIAVFDDETDKMLDLPLHDLIERFFPRDTLSKPGKAAFTRIENNLINNNLHSLRQILGAGQNLIFGDCDIYRTGLAEKSRALIHQLVAETGMEAWWSQQPTMEQRIRIFETLDQVPSLLVTSEGGLQKGLSVQDILNMSLAEIARKLSYNYGETTDLDRARSAQDKASAFQRDFLRARSALRKERAGDASPIEQS